MGQATEQSCVSAVYTLTVATYANLESYGHKSTGALVHFVTHFACAVRTGKCGSYEYERLLPLTTLPSLIFHVGTESLRFSHYFIGQILSLQWSYMTEEA